MSCLPPRQVLQVSRNRTEMSEAQRLARLSAPARLSVPLWTRMWGWLTSMMRLKKGDNFSASDVSASSHINEAIN